MIKAIESQVTLARHVEAMVHQSSEAQSKHREQVIRLCAGLEQAIRSTWLAPVLRVELQRTLDEVRTRLDLPGKPVPDGADENLWGRSGGLGE